MRIERNAILGEFVISVWLSLLCLSFGQDASYDLDMDGMVRGSDAQIQYSNFTGPLMPGAGSKTWMDGDFDEDQDVDTLDMLILWRHVRLIESNCTGQPEPVRADLVYDPATGAVLVDPRHSPCKLMGFTLVSGGGLLRPEKFSTTIRRVHAWSSPRFEEFSTWAIRSVPPGPSA